ncbi:MAG: UDP-N-acetylmuramoyl-L-alanyl-D-glutamate--2,6-diaminopimelate ligase [Bacteroidota bacterium]|nr:UDP-N-acetylmuramoyl-L-alanyl-D-glutamate--2,6-diaminopimelate ligase [Bacteroidota bacterium]
MKTLKDILKPVVIKQLTGDDSISVSDICFDSRKVTLGSLFIATRGTQTDGHNFISMAIEKGAVAVVCEEIPVNAPANITFVVVADASEALGYIASAFYDNPSSKLKLVGITGTNGKTTTVTLLYHMFKELGFKAGLISTVKYYVNDREVASTHTTPDAIQLNRLMAEMVYEGCEYCFIEVSSHSIVQHRIAGLKFAGAIFSNITHDHLDFHKTFDEYIKAKQKFFNDLPKDAFALTNLDDRNGMIMVQNTKASVKTYSLRSMADFRCKIIDNQFEGMQLQIDGTDVWTHFIGEFNAHNLLAVYASAVLLDQEKIEILKIISSLTSVSGRFETIRSNSGVTAIVDYAHTPDALENVLKTINQIRTGQEQLITVVGCGGDRDRTKRPEMAKIAADNSSKVILTSDNPRSEEPTEIIAEMMTGIDATNQRKVLNITDRREAIRTACMLAQKGDIILVAGKGHEDYQEVKGVKHHFDDREIVREQFQMLSNN